MTDESTIELPAYGWQPRSDQMEIWKYLEQGGKRDI